ncbi:Mu transposase C-terminal domain-containing protein [Thiohalorhabdus sp. Cl-TMA]|uniref:Mu transposase C-terminal domain-containing protein n=1 Tax=Thiohalorhabdus methylotrophus TaxID=3242694 RepID=A0ABV4TTG0_9GAMM
MTTLTDLNPGRRIKWRGHFYRVRELVTPSKLLVENASTGETKVLSVSDLQDIAPEEEEAEATEGPPDLATLHDKDWKVAKERFEAIRPLLELEKRTRADVKARAAETGCSPESLYRWMRLHQEAGVVAALAPKSRSGGEGKSRLSPEVEALLTDTLEEVYQKPRRPSVQHTCREVLRRCRNAGLEAPHPNTVRNRIAQLSEREKMKRREGTKAARERFAPKPGRHPEAGEPLGVVQIDHTKLDITLVDDLDRRPVGRPWLTLAIDIYSRMIVGFYLSFDPPSAESVGLCLSQAILPKDQWLAEREIDAEWPVQGVMSKIQSDNAREFRSVMLESACKNYGIDIEWRPVYRSDYGAYVERFFRTLNAELHNLPGTTKSSVAEKRDYEPDREAFMSLTEFETWLGRLITQVYHEEVHTELGMPPVRMYIRGIFGDDDTPGRGIAPVPTDTQRLRLSFTPLFERTVQSYGITLDKIHYYHDVLRRWIHATDPDNPKEKRKFLFRRDPRDISTVYFLDPEEDRYFPIPYRDAGRPRMSLWELREARKRAQELWGRADEDTIFEAYNQLRELEERAQKETRKARRKAQRRRDWRRAGEAPESLESESPPPKREAPSAEAEEEDEDVIEPFDEVEIRSNDNRD